MNLRALLLLAVAVHLMGADSSQAVKLIDTHCASCHDTPLPGTRVRPRVALQKMDAAAIGRSMESSMMRQQGQALTAKRGAAQEPAVS